MQPTGISSGLIRILPSLSPGLLAELLTPGQVLDADVVSVFQDRAILSFGRGARLEVALQAPLQEGQRVRVQVQAQPGAGAPQAPAQPAAAPRGTAPQAPQAPAFYPRPNLVVQAPPAAETEAATQPPMAQPQQPAPAEAPALAQPPAPAQPQAQPPAPGAVQSQPAAAAPTTPQPEQAGTPAQPAAPQQQPPQPASEQAAARPAQALPAQTAPAPGTTTTVSEFLTRQSAGLGTGPQQLLRPVILTQAGAAPAPAPADPQPQAAARQPAAAQPQQSPPATPGAPRPQADAAPPVVLKVIATLPPRDPSRPAGPAPAAVPAPAPDQPATASATAAKAAGAAATVREALATPGQPAPVSAPPPAQQPGAPQVFWLPVPLPDGKQGWAQLHIQEEEAPRVRGAKGGPTHEVRIWWETPSLGPVQVTLDAAADKLAALFTAAAPESKGALEALLPELQRRLSQVGFPEARVGCRTAAPGEAVEPARAQGASRLDKRL